MSRFWHRRSLMLKGIVLMAVSILPLLLALLFLGFNSLALARIDEYLPKLRQARLTQTQLEKGLVDAETGVRGYLLTGDESFLEPYNQAVAATPSLLAAVSSHENEFHRHTSTARIQALAERELALLAMLINEGPSRARLNEAKSVMDELRVVMGEIEAEEDREIADAIRRREDLRSQQVLLLLGGIGIGTLGGSVAGAILLRHIVGRIRATTKNARLLAEGRPLEPSLGGPDELGQLETSLQETARLLAVREEEMRAAKEEAERANSSKSDFLSRMSHELRTPLNSILGFAQLARTEVTDETAADLDQILRAGRHLLALIDEVLDISRIEAGKMTLSVESVSVAELVRESIELVRPLAAGEGVTIEVDGAASTTAAVLADRQRLKQVLLNLVSNAIKYNVINGTVRFGVTQDATQVTISVTDSGIGMSRSALERLFVPFDRMGAETSAVEGTGLGLALSARLVEVMNGRLEVDSDQGRGTTFRIVLPGAEPPEEITTINAEGDDATDRTSEEATSVLYIDDNLSNVKLVERILAKNFGGRLITAMQGRIGLELADKHEPNLILLDLHLPDIPGEEVLRRLRAQASTRDTYVIIVSANAMPSDVARLKEMGADGYVTKPFEIATLVHEIREALSMQRSEA